jgi:hypothetical protein
MAAGESKQSNRPEGNDGGEEDEEIDETVSIHQ